MQGVPPEDRDLGIVFQSYALFPHMSVAENVGYGLEFSAPPDGISKDERITELLELVDLSGMHARSPDALSGGQQQRVAIARSLAASPDILLLDEPMSALDAQLRERLRMQVRSIQTELGITTVYVTHDQEEALAISDRVAVMNEGTLEQIDSPRAIYHRPRSRFVAEFIGDNNVFTGAVLEAPSSDLLRVRIGTTTVSIATETSTTAVTSNDDHSPPDFTTDDRVTFCVRPEHLSINSGRNRLEATVRSTEFLGETTRTYLDWQNQELLVQSTKPPTDRVEVGFDPTDAHLIQCEHSRENTISKIGNEVKNR